jgi:uncharacterized protein (TIGR02147 family)
MTQALPVVFDYLDASQFLQDWFFFRKSTVQRLTYTAWAMELGLGSKTALRFILKKQRSISEKTKVAFIGNLKLSETEARYFSTLVDYSQAKTATARTSLGLSMIKIQQSRYRAVEVAASSAASDVWGPVILTLLSFEDVEGSVKELARYLGCQRHEVEASLEALEQKGLITKNELGYYKFGSVNFRIPDSLGSQSLRQFHEFWIDRSKQAIDLAPQTRKFRALKFALSESEFF